MKKYINKFLACSIIFALVVSSYGINTSGLYIYADAASKPKVVLKLDKASVSIEMGNTVTLKLSKKNVASVKKIAWVSKDKKIATVNSKGIVKGIKKGSTVVNATVKYKAKGASNLKSKKLSCKITVKGKPYVETETPAPTAEPVVYGTSGEVSVYNSEKSNYTLDINAANNVHSISSLLYGIFIEDINFAADGGLYA